MRDVVVAYGATPAVDGVSLHVARGEVVALLGPSGCGKSSLLRAVAGLEPLVAGAVAWDDDDLAGVPVHRRGFGLLFQDGQLFAHRDVAGNVGYGLPRGPGRAARVAQLLQLVGLPGAQRRDVATLSGGERQRVALARSLAPGPRLLLLDEPLSALDRALRERLAADLRAVLVATGSTALFVTHDQDEAFAVADRVAVMAAGRLLQVDEPAVLWRAPASREVAAFLGYEAFVAPGDPCDGPLRAGLAQAVGADGSSATARVAAAASAAPAGVLVRTGDTLALGPGALVVAAAGPLAGTVVAARLRRGRTELTVQVNGLGEVSVLVDGRTPPQPSDAVRLRVDPDRVAVLAP